MRPNHVKLVRHDHVHFHAENSGSGLIHMSAILFPEGNNPIPQLPSLVFGIWFTDSTGGGLSTLLATTK